MNLESEPNQLDKDMIIDDDKISRMADQFLEVREKMRESNPRVSHDEVIERILTKNHVPHDFRKDYKDLLSNRLIDRTVYRWESGEIMGSNPAPESVSLDPDFVERQTGKEPPEGWFTKWQNESEARRDEIHDEMMKEKKEKEQNPLSAESES